MSAISGLAIYDPHRIKPDEFLKSFVARNDLAQALLRKLANTPARGLAEHQLIVGQRGMGKTSLLRRLALGIERDPVLEFRFLPLTFREEQYNVRSLDRFWHNCGEALAEWAEQHDQSALATRLDRDLRAAVWCDTDAAAEAFLKEALALGRRPVLFIDNLDFILNALPAEQHWKLRNVLQMPEGPILYGASTKFLKQSGNQKQAFYEFFQPHLLEQLTVEEIVSCLRQLAALRGETGKTVLQVLASGHARLKTLHTLTGGNPRVLALIYQLLERSESETVFEDLEALLDHLTPFYKARIEDYKTDLQRAIIDAIALNWDPMTSHTLANSTGVPVTTVSSQVARLRKDGLIEEVETSGARAGYQLCERFFNIWYLMRHGTRRTRQKIQWLTKFLTSFYSPEDLVRLRAETDQNPKWDRFGFYREAVNVAIETAQYSKIEYNRSVGSEEKVVSSSGRPSHSSSNDQSAKALVVEAHRHWSLGRYEEAIGVYDDLIARFGEAAAPELREQVAMALVNKGFRLGSLGRSEEAVAVYDDLIARFSEAAAPELREQVARALFNKGFRLGSLGRSEEAVAVYDDLIARFGEAAAPELREGVARALFNKGFTLGSLGRSEEAMAVYDDLLARFGKAAAPELREQVAMALFNKGLDFGSLGRGEEAVAVYDDLIARFGEAAAPELREQVAKALVNKGFALGSLDRGEEAVAVYDDLVARFGEAAAPELREQVAMALFNKGLDFGSLGRGEEAVAVFDDLIARFGEAAEPELRERVAKALGNKGFRLELLGRGEEAVAVYDGLIARFGEAAAPELREQVAMALVNKGFALGSLGRSEEAVAVCDDLIARFGEFAEPELREQVAMALVNKGYRLKSLGRSEEAVTVYDDLIARFGEFAAPELRERVAKTQWLKANILADHYLDFEAARACYLQALSAEDPLIAKVNLTWLYIIFGRMAEARQMRAELGALEAAGLKLIDAGIALAADNFGEAARLLEEAYADDAKSLTTTFADDVLRLLRMMADRDYGERLIGWFKDSGLADRQAPLFAAFVAFVRGERHLNDFNPEVRTPARSLYRWLTNRKRVQGSVTHAVPSAGSVADR